jgi:hypothetical protein
MNSAENKLSEKQLHILGEIEATGKYTVHHSGDTRLLNGLLARKLIAYGSYDAKIGQKYIVTETGMSALTSGI